MMVSVETYLLRCKRQLDRLAARPGFRRGGKLALWGGGGLILSAAPLWGQMQPLSAALVVSCTGLPLAAAVLGSLLGYQLFWGQRSMEATVWVLGAAVLALAVPRLSREDRVPLHCAAGLSLLVAAAGGFFQLWWGDGAPPGLYLLRVGAAGCAAALFCLVTKVRERPLLWLSGALGVLGLAGMSRLPWLNPGCLAAGVLASIAPLPAAALSGAALEVAGFPAMTAAMCLAAMVRMLPIREQWRRLFAPALGATLALLLHPDGRWAALPCVALGGAVGALIPWHFPPLSRNTGTAAAQVQLEQAAQGLERLQRMLLTLSPPPIDREALAARLRENACADCSFRANCADQDSLNADLFRQGFSFHCRKTGRVLRELRRAQEQLRFLTGQRAKQVEYRSALARQYGMLSAYLQRTADRLPIRERPGLAKYRVQVSARSHSRETADGDRCESFPGTALRYYIVLCDGMGTGLGAEDEARSAVQMLKQMITAGIPVSCALGTMNDCMALRGRAGAVTVDLTEIRLDTGQAILYKWGAARSLLLRRGKLQTVGDISAPPGLRIGNSRENKTRISLTRSEMLVMLSDGIALPDDPDLTPLSRDLPPGELAEQILQSYVSASDDATVVAIRLQPTTRMT